MLASWGAEVIKVEPFKGDPMRTFGITMNCPDSPDETPAGRSATPTKKASPWT
jgi:crotonobetainyl-CoA:carnitine CoA-transferase CaiB-like acyl-CoA transferase